MLRRTRTEKGAVMVVVPQLRTVILTAVRRGYIALANGRRGSCKVRLWAEAMRGMPGHHMK